MYPPFPPGFQLGPLSIRWYGIIMVVAIFVGALIASRYVARRGQESDSVWSLLLWVIIPAIIGARLYYVFLQAPRGPDGLGNYLAHPLEILEIWQGGIHAYGGLLGGGIALLIYLHIKKLPALIYLDAVGLALLPAQAIGCLGDFMNQGLYGPPTNLPWGLRIDPAYRIAPYTNLSLYPTSIRFQPLFLYEMILDLVGFVIIFWLARRFEKKWRAGDLALMYLIWYPFVRFFLEFSRTDAWFFPGTPFDFVHIFSAIAIVASIILLITRHRNRLASFPVATMIKKRAWAEPDEEEEAEAMEGLGISEEYTFMRSSRQAGIEEYVENPEETEEDEKLEEESEGTEDMEIGSGELLDKETIEEGEEYMEEEYMLEENEKLKEPDKKEREKTEEEEEEMSEDETEEASEEEGKEEEVEEENEEEEEEETGVEESEGEAGEEGEGEESVEDEAEEAEEGEESAGDGEGTEECEEGEDDAEAGDEEGEDDGDAGDSSDE